MVKKIFFALSIMILFTYGQAMATEQVFDSKIGKFSIDVPDNWTAKKVTEGCKINSDDNMNSMTLQIVRTNSSLQDLSLMIAKAMGMNIKENKLIKDNENFLGGDVNGTAFAIYTIKYDEFFLISICGGADKKTMDSIRDSAKQVK